MYQYGPSKIWEQESNWDDDSNKLCICPYKVQFSMDSWSHINGLGQVKFKEFVLIYHG